MTIAEHAIRYGVNRKTVYRCLEREWERYRSGQSPDKPPSPIWQGGKGPKRYLVSEFGTWWNNLPANDGRTPGQHTHSREDARERISSAARQILDAKGPSAVRHKSVATTAGVDPAAVRSLYPTGTDLLKAAGFRSRINTQTPPTAHRVRPKQPRTPRLSRRRPAQQKFTEDRQLKLLANVKAGATVKHAADALGLTFVVVYTYARNVPEFSKRLDEAITQGCPASDLCGTYTGYLTGGRCSACKAAKPKLTRQRQDRREGDRDRADR